MRAKYSRVCGLRGGFGMSRSKKMHVHIFFFIIIIIIKLHEMHQRVKYNKSIKGDRTFL